MWQGCDDRKALRNDVLVRRETVVRQRFPFDEMRNRHIRASEISDFGFQLVGMPRIIGQDDDWFLQ